MITCARVASYTLDRRIHERMLWDDDESGTHDWADGTCGGSPASRGVPSVTSPTLVVLALVSDRAVTLATATAATVPLVHCRECW